MPKLMPGRQVLVPAEYAKHQCLLVQYWLPGLSHCYVLCHDPLEPEGSSSAPTEVQVFLLSQARALAFAATGDHEAFLLVHSGASVRKRQSWHLHVFVIQHRWQKAWAYAILCAKNFLQAGLETFQGVSHGRPAPNPSVKGTSCGKPQAAPYLER